MPNYLTNWVTEIGNGTYTSLGLRGLELRAVNSPYVHDNHFTDRTWTIQNIGSRNGIFYNNLFEKVNKPAHVQMTGIINTNCGDIKIPNKAIFNEFDGLANGIYWNVTNNSITNEGYFTQCNTFNNMTMSDMTITTNAMIMNPHGSCGQYSLANNYFTSGNANMKNINNTSGTNLTYIANQNNGTYPTYYANVNRVPCAVSWGCNAPENLMVKADPDSVMMSYNLISSLISAYAAISSPTADQVDSLNWLKWERSGAEYIVTRNYMQANKPDSAIYILQNDSSFTSRYILTNLYMNLGQDSNAQDVIAAYSGYSGSDSEIIDFVNLYTYHIAAKNSGNAITYTASHESTLADIASHASNMAEQAKAFYNWYKLETDTSLKVPYPMTVDILPDTSIETDTVLTDVDSSCITVSISPNPMSTTVNVTVSNSDCGNQYLYQRVYRLFTGEMVDSRQFTLGSSASNISTVDLSGEPSGFYYITVDNSSSIMVTRLFIKQ